MEAVVTGFRGKWKLGWFAAFMDGQIPSFCTTIPAIVSISTWMVMVRWVLDFRETVAALASPSSGIQLMDDRCMWDVSVVQQPPCVAVAETFEMLQEIDRFPPR